MSHTTTRRCGHTSDKSNNWFIRITMCLQPFRCLFLSTSTNLTNHNDTFRLRIVSKSFQTIDKVGTIERVSTNSNTGTLTKASHGRLMNSLVSKCTRTTHNSNLSWRMDISRHYTNFAFARLDYTGTIRSNQPSFVLALQSVLHLCHVLLGHPLCNCHYERDFIFNGVQYCLGTERRRDINNRRIWFHSLHSFGDSIEHWKTQMRLTSLVGGHTSHHIRAIINSLLTMKGTLFPGKSLTNDTSILIYPDLGSGGHAACRNNFSCFRDGNE
mmetsp:Transcript_6957/g.13139  ORF Transcript_6957/g.13139 Transcript_6957/m.13139 type:complete len:270 (+) Transcript_6957:293-1102(+)